MCPRDEESFLSRSSPGQPAVAGNKLWKELKQNWWLWGSIAFAVLLIGSLVVFRNSLYDTAAHGLPFLAGVVLLVVKQLLESHFCSCNSIQPPQQPGLGGKSLCNGRYRVLPSCCAMHVSSDSDPALKMLHQVATVRSFTLCSQGECGRGMCD